MMMISPNNKTEKEIEIDNNSIAESEDQKGSKEKVLFNFKCDEIGLNIDIQLIIIINYLNKFKQYRQNRRSA